VSAPVPFSGPCSFHSLFDASICVAVSSKLNVHDVYKIGSVQTLWHVLNIWLTKLFLLRQLSKFGAADVFILFDLTRLSL